MRLKKYKQRLDKDLYAALKDFQGKREAITRETAQKIAVLERFAGSPGYEEDCKAIREKEAARLEALRADYKKSCNAILSKMDAAVDARPTIAPTADMVNVLTVLKMREQVTVGDLETAANAVKDCPIALEVVQECAQKAGIHRNFRSYNKSISSGKARDINNAIRSGVDDFINHDTTRASRIAAEHRATFYGGEPALRKRPLFDTQEECYKELLGLGGDLLTSWADVVNDAYYEGDPDV